MRPLLLGCLAIALSAGDAVVPEAARKLVDESTATVGRSRAAFDAAVKKEQDRLVAALQKEQEKETRKGNLEGALAIKRLIAEAESGGLLSQTATSGDLLGESAPPVAENPVAAVGPVPKAAMPADLLTDCRIPTGNYPAGAAPEALEEFMRRSVILRLPADDRTHYQFSAQLAGAVVVIAGGTPAHAALWSELERSGFRQVPGGAATQRWYLANLRLNERFTVGNVEGGVPTLVLAARIKPAR